MFLRQDRDRLAYRGLELLIKKLKHKPMNKYESLLNKDIGLEFQGNCVNTFKITEMTPTTKTVPGFESRGSLYDCKVEWSKKMPGTPEEQVMGFDEQTLNDLLNNKVADCPGMSALKYKVY